MNNDIRDIMLECYASVKKTAKVLFPDRFTLPFSTIHEKIFAPLEDPSIQKVVIKAPRGWGKTSICNLAYPAKNILFREKEFIVPISNTSTQAVMQSENLKRELMVNRTIRQIFGNVKTNDNIDGVDLTFSKEMWVANGKTLVFPRGSGQQVRGILYGNSRPDLIVCDDVEDSESCQNEEQRKKLKDWFFADVLNSVNRSRKDWKVVFIGTLLHEDSLLAHLLEDETWYKVELDLCDDDLTSNWPDFMSTEEVKKLYASYKAQGMLDTFFREYRGLPVAKDQNFKQEYFKQYNEGSQKFITDVRKKLESVIIIDPAKTTNFESADSAIVGLGVDISIPAIYVRDIEAGKFHPDQIYQKAFNMADRLGAKTIAIEVTSLNEFVTYPIKTEMIKQRRFYNLIELKARDKKENRIAMLIPFYRMGYIWHNETACAQLEAQLLSFPRSKRFDVMDATAYIVELLEMGERYFMPTQAKDDDEDMRLVEDEYADLDEDNEPIAVGWRTI